MFEMSIFDRLARSKPFLLGFVILLAIAVPIWFFRLQWEYVPHAYSLFWAVFGAMVSALLASIVSFFTPRTQDSLCTYQKYLKRLGVRDIFISDTSEELPEITGKRIRQGTKEEATI